MEEDFEEPTITLVTVLLHGGPLFISVLLVVAGLTLRHLWVSLRGAIRPSLAVVPVGVHVMYLISTPVIIAFYLLARISTSFPGLFIVGVDAEAGLQWGLREAEFLGLFGLVAFPVSLLAALSAIHRTS